MTSRALRVPRSLGEATRQALRERGWLRTDLSVTQDAEFLLLPLTDDANVPPDLGTVVEVDLKPAPDRGPSDYRELVEVAPEFRARLPRSFDVVGDVVLVRIPDELDSYAPAIGAALLRFVPGARVVGIDLGVQGPERRRVVRRIAGEGGWSTRHRENGLEFDVDLEGAYFSPRLAREHARVAAAVRSGERVYDLCCGVGPFSVTIARDGRARRVVAVDANPVASELLRRTLARYPFGARVEVVSERIEEFLTRNPPFETVIFNLPREGIKYLPSVGNAVSLAGRLFYYEVTEREAADGRPEALVQLLGPSSWRPVDRHVVHPFSPTSDLVAYQLERHGE